jgi:hypothetical protein
MKFCAVGAVVGFTGFFIFGFLAFFAAEDIGASQWVDIVLSAGCLIIGILAWRKISSGMCETPIKRE